MPGVIRNVPGWLFDPLGPLSLRWTYLPAIAPWLVRFIRAGTPGEGARPGARPAPARRPDARRPEAAGSRRRRRGSRPSPRPSLRLPLRRKSLRRIALAWELRRENGVEIDEFDADELRQLEPALSRDYVRGLLVRENGHTSNPLGLVERLLEYFLRSGGELCAARAHGFRLDGGRLAAIQTDSGELAADAAIVCAGAYSKPLAAALGDKVPLETERGYHLMIIRSGSRCRGSRPPTPTASSSRRRWTRGCALPAPSSSPALRHLPIGGAPAILLEQGRKMLPGLAASHPEERISVWMGHRPSLPELAAGAGAVKRDAGCDLRLRPRPCRDDCGADDRQDRRRSRRRAPAFDRHRRVCSRPVPLNGGRLSSPAQLPAGRLFHLSDQAFREALDIGVGQCPLLRLEDDVDSE